MIIRDSLRLEQTLLPVIMLTWTRASMVAGGAGSWTKKPSLEKPREKLVKILKAGHVSLLGSGSKHSVVFSAPQPFSKKMS